MFTYLGVKERRGKEGGGGSGQAGEVSGEGGVEQKEVGCRDIE